MSNVSIKELEEKIAKLEENCAICREHIDTALSDHKKKEDFLLGEISVNEQLAVEQFANKLKDELFYIYINSANDTSTMLKYMLYQINKYLNEDFGFNAPLSALNQLIYEKELVRKYLGEEVYEKEVKEQFEMHRVKR